MTASPKRSRPASGERIGRQFKKVVIGAFGLMLLAGCGSMDAALDCQAICMRYSSCYDTSYDTDACETRCKSNAEADPEYKRQADICDACIVDRACASATFSCGADCTAVVP